MLPCTAPIGVLICVCSSPSFPAPNSAFVGTKKLKLIMIPPNIFIFFYNPRLSIHELISDSDAPPWNRSPSFQSPVPVISSRRLPLSPIPDEAAVQNGMTVFPVKSLSFTKLSTGHAAIPHQGYVLLIRFLINCNAIFIRKLVHIVFKIDTKCSSCILCHFRKFFRCDSVIRHFQFCHITIFL